MMRSLPALLALVALAAPACHRGAVAPINPRAEVALNVDNQNFLDMNVYLIRSGQRIRIGTVPGLSSRVLMLRPEYVGYGTELRFEVHPIGGRGQPISQTHSLPPRDRTPPPLPP